jgi:UDP-N-acetylbacillosamine N-acetyltransferase
MSQVVIWGASGHAMVVADIVRLQGIYTIAGFLDNINPQRRGTAFCESVILGGEEQLALLPAQGIKHILLGFGDCQARLEKSQYLLSQGFSLPVAIHPGAIVARDVVIGSGTVVAAGAVINPGTRIGCSAIINTSASVDHECVVEDAAHISPGAHLAGQVTIGAATHIGIGAVIIQRIAIGAGTVVGAGAVVVEDLPAHVIAYGVPAKIKRSIE